MRKGYTEDRDVIYGIFAEADVLTLALADADGPYSVPVNFVHEGDVIFVHTGKRGRKTACLDSGAKLAFSVIGDARFKSVDGDACEQGFHYRSVCGSGMPQPLEGEEKLRALQLLADKYTPEPMHIKDTTALATNIYAIELDTVSARVRE